MSRQLFALDDGARQNPPGTFAFQEAAVEVNETAEGLMEAVAELGNPENQLWKEWQKFQQMKHEEKLIADHIEKIGRAKRHLEKKEAEAAKQEAPQ